MKPRIVLAILAGAMILTLACAGDETGPNSSGGPGESLPTGMPTPAAMAAPVAPQAASMVEEIDRLIVRTVSMGLLVDEVAKALEAISSLADEMGGFVVSSRIGGEKQTTFGSISIRVPADRTGEALSRLRGMAVRVTNESTSAQDVTEEYVDLEARLRNLERTEEQYLRLFDRADKVEDVLRVQRELSNVQGQIDQIKGRMQYLERTSATSLITVELRPASSPEPLARPGWSPVETAMEAVRGLTGFGQGLVDLAIRIGVFAPAWAPLLIVAWWLQERFRRRLRPGGSAA